METDSRNPWDDQNWSPLKREATLVRQLLGSGVTSLGKASYSDGLGNYYNAFFSLSIGIERLAKLICVCDHAMDHHGVFQNAKLLKNSYGHDIPKLLAAVEAISQNRNLSLSFPRPVGDIQNAIVECLSSFADAKQGRYNNFDALDDADAGGNFEPLRKWWNEVAETILVQHYYGESAQSRVETNARMIDDLSGAISSVTSFDECGQLMNDLYAASVHTGKTEIVQKQARFYTLTIIRWLSDVFGEVSKKACYDKGLGCFFGHHEFLDCYRLDDSFLKTRKIWPC